ncbi:MAG: nucleoside hydrolase [Myxococcota bacterium]
MSRWLLDVETSDPDDYLTLLLLLAHPAVDLAAVTVTPGTAQQIAVVRHALASLDRNDVRVGALDLDRPKDCVSRWHYEVLPLRPADVSRQAEPAPALLGALIGPDTTLVTGAPLKNLGAVLRARPERDPGALGRVFVQGGFAGDDVVPFADRLPKFRGRVTCPSFNLNGDPKSALLAVERAAWFGDLRFVSKNVCHGVVWDAEVADAVAVGIGRATGRWKRALQEIARCLAGMDGKALHDPFAACCAIEPAIARWAPVVPYRAKGEWGGKARPVLADPHRHGLRPGVPEVLTATGS